jgi:hypothetical protein
MMTLDTPAAVLSPVLEALARRFVDARRRAGESMLQAAAALAEAREAAQLGEWYTFLEAVGTSQDDADRLLAIHRKSLSDPRFADAVRRDWLPQTVAALLAKPSTPATVVEAALSAPQPPTVREVRQQIAEAKAPGPRTGAGYAALDPDIRPVLEAAGYRFGGGGVNKDGTMDYYITLHNDYRIVKSAAGLRAIADALTAAPRTGAGSTLPPAPDDTPTLEVLFSWRARVGLIDGGWDLGIFRSTSPDAPYLLACPSEERWAATWAEMTGLIEQLEAQAALIARARAAGLTATPEHGGLMLYWPDEDPTKLLPLAWEDVGGWLDQYAADGPPVADTPAPPPTTADIAAAFRQRIDAWLRAGSVEAELAWLACLSPEDRQRNVSLSARMLEWVWVSDAATQERVAALLAGVA